MDTFAVVDYPAVDIQLDRTWSPSDRKRRTNGWTSQAAGVYPGLDRFGRVISQSWLDGVTGSTAAGYRPAIVDQIHIYDLASNRLSKRDGRAGASWAGRDWEYGYDSLGRLTEARQGARTGVTNSSQGTWIPAAGGQEWVLDMLGNWTEQRTDLTGNGVFTDALDRSDARSHNLANELTQRVVTPTAGGTTSTNSVTLPLAYDAAGNLAEESTTASTKRRYTHDAWGRLVKVESLDANNAAKPLSTHRFNGLHWRIEKHWHAVPDAADLADRKTTFWYDAAWRVVQETQRDQTNGAGTLEESIIQQVWGARYIDDAVARMRVTGNGSGGVAAGAAQELAFQLTDAQFSVIAVATPGKPGVVIDRIAYSPYGEATRTLRSDVNGDGFVNQSDYTGIIRPRNGATIGTAAYIVEADLDRNGVINQLDYDISIADDGKSSSGGVGEAGLFSRGVRNSIGYCGYIFNEDSGLYTVRFRTYSPTLGRWLERDPAGYVDGMGLYEYVRGGAIGAVDPWGLQAAPPIDDPGPFEVGWEWLVNPDGSPEQREFGPEHSFTKQLREHEHIAEVQRKLRDLLADTCDSCSQDGALSHGRARVGETFGGSFDGQELDPETGKLRNRGPGLSYSLAGWQGVPKYLRDYSVITSFGLTGSLAVTFLGSYSVEVTVLAIDCESGTMTVQFQVDNSTTLTSGTRPPKLGYTDWWRENIEPVLQDLVRDPKQPMATKRQRFVWTEEIRLGPRAPENEECECER